MTWIREETLATEVYKFEELFKDSQQGMLMDLRLRVRERTPKFCHELER